jgi:hypothetical protein
MSRGFRQRWRERCGRTVRIGMPFADLMEVALALLALTPDELGVLGWRFEDRRRLLEHVLASGREADAVDRDVLEQAIIAIRLPLRDVRRLQAFARRELPKHVTRAAVIDRLERAIEVALALGR